MIFWGGDRLFGNQDTFFGPLAVLLLLVISAAISGTLVFGKAAVLFWEKKYKECFTLVGWTLGWAVFFLLSILSLFIFV